MKSFASASRNREDNREHSIEEETGSDCSPERQSVAERVLEKAIEQERLGLESLPAARFQLLKVFGRIERLAGQIDEAFGGQPFRRNLPPDCPANRRRFNAYFECHAKVTGLLAQAIKLWMMTCGMKEEDDWVPLVIAEMNLQAAKKPANAIKRAGEVSSGGGDGLKSS